MREIIINCGKLNKELKINQEESIFNQLIKLNIPVASSCKGEGVCKWCKITVIKGQDFLNEATELEIKANLKKNERLLCQVKSSGDITIDTNYW